MLNDEMVPGARELWGPLIIRIRILLLKIFFHVIARRAFEAKRSMLDEAISGIRATS